MALRFEWDPQKDEANQRKHGIDFQEASTAFEDEAALLLDDPEHSTGDEDRLLLLGLSSRLRLLLVVHCYRENDEVIRIISARPATTGERRFYVRRFPT
jgi:uncharacterized DUF497 family protein